jgi:hypothetical protein
MLSAGAMEEIAAPHNHETARNRTFELILEMVSVGVTHYFAFDPKKEDPKSLVAEVPYSSRDIWLNAR